MCILLYKYRTYKYCRRLTVGSLKGPYFLHHTPYPSPYPTPLIPTRIQPNSFTYVSAPLVFVVLDLLPARPVSGPLTPPYPFPYPHPPTLPILQNCQRLAGSRPPTSQPSTPPRVESLEWLVGGNQNKRGGYALTVFRGRETGLAGRRPRSQATKTGPDSFELLKKRIWLNSGRDRGVGGWGYDRKRMRYERFGRR